jgi:hypothetical protein
VVLKIFMVIVIFGKLQSKAFFVKIEFWHVFYKNEFLNDDKNDFIANNF